jgi:hypothetical protein
MVRVAEQAAIAWTELAAYLRRLQAEQRAAPAAHDDGLDIPKSLRRTA